MRSWWTRTAMTVGVSALLFGCDANKDPATDPDTDPVDSEAPDSEPVVDTEPTDTLETDDTPVSDDPCVVGQTPMIEIGTGESSYTALADGDTVQMEEGGQDPPGYHVWGSVRLRNVPQFVRVRYALTDVPTGIVLGDYNFNVALLPIPEDQPWACVGRYSGMLGVLNVWRAVRTAASLPEDAEISEVLCGTDLRLDFEVFDGDASLAADSVTVTVQPDPDVAPPCETPIR